MRKAIQTSAAFALIVGSQDTSAFQQSSFVAPSEKPCKQHSNSRCSQTQHQQQQHAQRRRRGRAQSSSSGVHMQAMGYPPLPVPFPPKREHDLKLAPGEVAVRFIGTEDGVERVVAAKEGDSLIPVATKAGVKIATSCRSGLCNTCTTDLEDPNWPTSKTYRPGYQPFRACVAKVSIAEQHIGQSVKRFS